MKKTTRTKEAKSQVVKPEEMVAAKEENQQVVKPAKTVKTVSPVKTVRVSPMIHKCMRLYSNLPELYISDEGFVYVKGTPAKMRGNAKLYKNIYYKK